MQEGNAVAGYAKNKTLATNGSGVVYDIRRRDSFGMRSYYHNSDINDYANWVTTYGIPLIAENGWNYFGHRSTDSQIQSYTASASDRHENLTELLNFTLLNHVIPSRAYTFDMRVVEDAEKW